MAFDPKCYDLASIFLGDEPHLLTEKRCSALAQIIQTAIEDFIREENDNYEPPDPPGFEAGFAENH